ncbi:MAG: rhomboid family intramembrane serine protease [Candidatus Latescibacterota bacterium]|nr:rhomboid family intramembrane serine protease [Candidatus Latescibacterota bacterium]
MFGLAQWMRRFGVNVDFPHLITITCVSLFLLALILDLSAVMQPRDMMSILEPGGMASIRVGMTGKLPVLGGFAYNGYYDRGGRWWTVITAIYLHGSLLHILFNMLWVRQLGPVVEQLFGTYRLFIIFTVAGVTGFVASVMMGNLHTLGASGSIFGLLAAAIVYGRKRGSALFTRQFLQWAVLMFVFGLIMPGIDNWAHGGGFGGGYVTAWLFSRQPDDREGIGTYLLAGICLLATVGAFVLQFFASIDL